MCQRTRDIQIINVQKITQNNVDITCVTLYTHEHIVTCIITININIYSVNKMY